MIRIAPAALAVLALAACGDSGAPDTAAQAPAEAETQTAPAEPAAPAAEAPENAADRWTVDQAQSALTFAGEIDGEAFDGEFSDWSADIWFDPDNLEGSKIDARVNLASLGTGDSDRDETATSADWLGPGEARFVSNSVTATQGGYAAQGVLTIKDQSHPFNLPFSVAISGDTANAQAAFGFERAGWNVGGGDFDGAVSDSISVTIEVAATR
ncbi:YceI family protein [Euryhalocaulis caribicus]|uniref:YceI family protein n=1 Tax=Euryhalocaulis caribicus TaxID=1161401 RepID=UPI0003AAD439|nr:YceI family protein [Euryhalocaulis caribicus]